MCQSTLRHARGPAHCLCCVLLTLLCDANGVAVVVFDCAWVVAMRPAMHSSRTARRGAIRSNGRIHGRACVRGGRGRGAVVRPGGGCASCCECVSSRQSRSRAMCVRPWPALIEIPLLAGSLAIVPPWRAHSARPMPTRPPQRPQRAQQRTISHAQSDRRRRA